MSNHSPRSQDSRMAVDDRITLLGPVMKLTCHKHGMTFLTLADLPSVNGLKIASFRINPIFEKRCARRRWICVCTPTCQNFGDSDIEVPRLPKCMVLSCKIPGLLFFRNKMLKPEPLWKLRKRNEAGRGCLRRARNISKVFVKTSNL